MIPRMLWQRLARKPRAGWPTCWLMFNTGARVSEIIGVRVADVVLGPTSSVRLHGKGRKQRSLPLWKSAASLYANAFGKSHQSISLEDFLLAAAAKLNRCPLWTGNRKHYPMEDIQLFSG